MSIVRHYGWKPDLPDRNYPKFLRRRQAAELPSRIDLRLHCPPVVDQGALGSCTGNALAGAYDYARIRQGFGAMGPSRLFIYYNERVEEGSVNYDAGAIIADGIDTLNTLGVCPETLWPYDISRFTERPPDAAYTAALTGTVKQRRRVNNADADDIKAALTADDGGLVVIGFSVYREFESPEVTRTGVVPMPGPASGASIGGHAVCIVGYDDAKQVWICRNSWGADWGMAGYFTVPYGYFTDTSLADDAWLINVVGGDVPRPPGPPTPPPVPPTPPAPPQPDPCSWLRQSLRESPTLRDILEQVRLAAK